MLCALSSRTAAAGVDEKVDLLPPAMLAQAQLQFLHEQCARAPETSFSETVEVLYAHLQLSGPGR